MTIMTTITKQAEAYLEALAKALEIPPSRYMQAERSYQSLGDWLCRDESGVNKYNPDVFVQGSFRLGTAIKPQSDLEEYDVDCVSTLTELKKLDLSQSKLKELVGEEIKAFRNNKGISKPVQSKQRCWRLDYADEAQFHMDIVPAIPNAGHQRRLLELKNLGTRFADTAIAITDNKAPEYYVVTNDWPRSNPRGYAKWFEIRMGEVFIHKREQMLDEMRLRGLAKSVEDIPTYLVRTPLQSAIMILKRHRDIMFADCPTEKPASIIISTLAAHAYQGEVTIGYALQSILIQMDRTIFHDGNKYIIKNPTDELENFADKWEDHPERAEAFFNWLKQIRKDFARTFLLSDHRHISRYLTCRMGGDVTDQASEAFLRSSRSGKSSLLSTATVASATSAPSVSFADTPRTPKKPEGFA